MMLESMDRCAHLLMTHLLILQLLLDERTLHDHLRVGLQHVGRRSAMRRKRAGRRKRKLVRRGVDGRRRRDVHRRLIAEHCKAEEHIENRNSRGFTVFQS